MTRDEIESRVEELEAESKYAEDSPGKLYLKTLKDAHDQCEDHPGAGEAYIRRWRAHRCQMAARPPPTDVRLASARVVLALLVSVP